MATDRDTYEPPALTPEAAIDAQRTESPPDHTSANTGPSQPHDEATIRTREALPSDTMILAPAFAPPPMRCPDDVWAMLVTAVDLTGDAAPGRAGDVALFAGNWVHEQPPADNLYDGDLVVRLIPTDPTSSDHATTDVEMLLAYRGRWQPIGHWHGIDDRWPGIVAPTAATVMGLHGDATEAGIWSKIPPPSALPPLIKWARGGITELLDAGMITVGEEVVWNRPNLGVRHIARIRGDGTLILADGRVYANPSGATTALGGNHQNGWSAFRRASDGRTLGDLRSEIRARRGQ
jgi:hypothetical protein